MDESTRKQASGQSPESGADGVDSLDRQVIEESLTAGPHRAAPDL